MTGWPSGLRPLLLAVLLAARAVKAGAQDEVPVPGGPASVRRLLGLDPARSKSVFFLDVHEVLLFASPKTTSWSDVESRRKVVNFVGDLTDWRQRFGSPATFSLEPGEPRRRVEQALEWLGFKVRGDGKAVTVERRSDGESLRRQGFLDALGVPPSLLLAKLRAGEAVTVPSPDELAPLPFGLAAWRETLSEPKLSAQEAFLFFVKDVRASRMLVALHSLDPETRETSRTFLRDEKGRRLGWAMLYDKVSDPFHRFPEALMLRDGRFELPGGKDAAPIWADIFGTSPSDRAGFLTALYGTDNGKGAYVVSVLQRLPDRSVKELLFGRTGGGERSVRRFRRLCRSIESAGDNYERTWRDPYDFAHLAPFLRLSDEGDLLLPAADLESDDFPRSEAELTGILSRAAGRPKAREESLRRLFHREAIGKTGSFPAQRRLLFVSSLLAEHPSLGDAGLLVLLYRGLDRFLPAYAVLEDLPLTQPALARRYLFTLDRLARREPSRDAELAAGIFEADVELLAQLSRSGALEPEEIRGLFSALLDVPLFSLEGASPAESEQALDQWLSGRLLAALRRGEDRLIESRRIEKARREEEYRQALRSRDERILERRAAARAEAESERAAAAERLRAWMEPVCPSRDDFVGPAPQSVLEEIHRLADRLAASPAGVGSPAEATARQWVEEALELEASRARPQPPEPEPRRRAGALSGSRALEDAAEPLPRLVRVEVPEPSRTPDDLLTASLVGPPRPSVFEWRGGRYRFDPPSDDATRRRAFREKQLLASLADLEALHHSRDAMLAAAKAGDLAATRSSASELARGLRLASGGTAGKLGDEDERVLKVENRAREAAAEIAQLTKSGRLSRIGEWVRPLDAVLAERHLEALLGHVYAAAVGEPNDLYYQDPGFVRRHSFRVQELAGRILQSPFMKTSLVQQRSGGGGSRIAGSLFGLPDVLGLLHSDQLTYEPGAGADSDEIRAGLVAPVWRMSSARLDDDALRLVAASCRATLQLAVALADRSASERFRAWNEIAKDLVPRSRLGLLASLSGGESAELVSQYLSSSDLYRVGRRLAAGGAPEAVPAVPAAAEAREILALLQRKYGEAGARDRLAEFGPRAVSYAGRFRLADIDLPAYEQLASYRLPHILADRLYDLKITVACRVAEAGLPAAVLPLVLPAALDGMLTKLRMAYSFDWASTVRAGAALSRSDVDRLLDEAVREGRLVRDDSETEEEES